MVTTKKFYSAFRWIQIGSGRSFRALIRWVESGKTKEVQKKRVGALGGTALAVVALSVEFPAVVPAAVLVLLLGTIAWWGTLPHEEMTMKFSDFQAPVEIDGAAFLGGEVLKKYAEKFPGESAAQLAARLSRVPGAESIDEDAVKSAYAQAGIPLADAKPAKESKVTREEEEAGAKYHALFEKAPSKAAGKFIRERLAARQEAKAVTEEKPEVPEGSEGPMAQEGDAAPGNGDRGEQEDSVVQP